MVIRDHTLAHGRWQEGQLRLIDELPQLRLRPRPGGALPHNQQRALRALQRLNGGGHACVAHLRPRRRGHPRLPLDLALFRAGVNDVARQVDVDGTGPPAQGFAHRRRDEARDQPDVGRAAGPLHEGAHVLHGRRLLEVAPRRQIERRGAAQQEHRPGVLLRVAQRGNRVRDAGSRDDECRPDMAAHIGSGLGGVSRRLFVAGADIAHPRTLRLLGHGHHGNAHHAKQLVDALVL